MPAPKKGKRFGGSAADQKLMLANLCVDYHLRGRRDHHDRSEGEGAAALRREAGHEREARRRAQAAPNAVRPEHRAAACSSPHSAKTRTGGERCYPCGSKAAFPGN